MPRLPLVIPLVLATADALVVTRAVPHTRSPAPSMALLDDLIKAPADKKKDEAGNKLQDVVGRVVPTNIKNPFAAPPPPPPPTGLFGRKKEVYRKAPSFFDKPLLVLLTLPILIPTFLTTIDGTWSPKGTFLLIPLPIIDPAGISAPKIPGGLPKLPELSAPKLPSADKGKEASAKPAKAAEAKKVDPAKAKADEAKAANAAEAAKAKDAKQSAAKAALIEKEEKAKKEAEEAAKAKKAEEDAIKAKAAAEKKAKEIVEKKAKQQVVIDAKKAELVEAKRSAKARGNAFGAEYEIEIMKLNEAIEKETAAFKALK